MSITSFFRRLPYSEAYYFQWESRGSEWLKCNPPFRLHCFCPWEQIEKVVDQHIRQQREREKDKRSLMKSGWTGIEEMPGGTRSLCFCHLTPQRISRPATCRPSQHACLSFSHSLFVLWITDVLKNSRVDADPAQQSGNGTVKSLSCCRKREKQREVDRVGGRGQPVGLPLACSSLLGLPWCWVQRSQLREEHVCAHGCTVGTASHWSRPCSSESARGQEVGPACPVTRRTHS